MFTRTGRDLATSAIRELGHRKSIAARIFGSRHDPRKWAHDQLPRTNVRCRGVPHNLPPPRSIRYRQQTQSESANRFAPGSVIRIASGSFEASATITQSSEAWNHDLQSVVLFAEPREIC